MTLRIMARAGRIRGVGAVFGILRNALPEADANQVGKIRLLEGQPEGDGAPHLCKPQTPQQLRTPFQLHMAVCTHLLSVSYSGRTRCSCRRRFVSGGDLQLFFGSAATHLSCKTSRL